MITPAQCRAARGLLDWTQQELAEAARIGVATIRLFEGEAAESRHATLAVLRRAFELAGVEFIDENGGGPGLRLRKRQRAKPANIPNALKILRRAGVGNPPIKGDEL